MSVLFRRISVLRDLGGGAAQCRGFRTTAISYKVQAGRYKPSMRKNFKLTYEMSLYPEEIANKKGWNSFNTAQLEGTFLEKEAIGQDLPYKMLVEDMFIRKFMKGTWPGALQSEVIIKRTHNLIRVAAILNRRTKASACYFLIGYTEEMLSLWLKCPVKLELQTAPHDATVVRLI